MLDHLTPRRGVELAIKTEELGQRIYGKLARRFRDDPEIRAVFEVLARDEELHRRQFAQLLD
jgi:rubrerythrin